jgi:uracil-DNA glycosylase
MSCKFQTWNDFFQAVQNKEYFVKMNQFIDEEYSQYICYPPKELIFNAFKQCELNKVKVVMFGQDPYHEPDQAMGLCFSVPIGVKVPPSLVNIYKEWLLEYNREIDFHNGDLTYLANQGCLLLNAILTVREHSPLSHNIKEYDLFFKDVLSVLNSLDQPIVFLLWGGNARKLKKYLNNPKHLVLEANHPSPLSANRGGWFGNNHFKLANDFLKENNLKEIDWIKN